MPKDIVEIGSAASSAPPLLLFDQPPIFLTILLVNGLFMD